MNRIWNNFFRTGGVLATAGLLAGCETVDFSRPERVSGPDYEPANVHRLPAGVPEKIRRVAVLPLVSDARGAQAEAGAETMQSVLVTELVRSGAFEILAVSADDLSHATGRGQWTAEEKLPAAFFQKLREQHGCDAVLFSRLTQYRAYPPLAVGWSFKLVECPAKPAGTPRILWAADEVFDAGNPTVVNSARRYYLGQLKVTGPLADSQAMLHTPRRFAQYTLHALALTLPPREFAPQVPPPPADGPSEMKPKQPAPGAGGSE
ncbi:MAG: hypothetical protein FD161_4391 [Limisphaerales bacterium]|nr:MAG: hypothetical protein FD161_4391 [Limisphaerales bacterium]KAG0506957.1 MAG: hypothetical protein E1N63_3899 [Limisphaerales bacterium]TXT49193.1 MAG: hypothetical protein FD140_3202 [Limisphaerales bacterium]